MTTGRHESCATVALHRYGADIRPQACMEAAPLWSYATEMQTYVHRHAWKLHHCGADIRLHACMEAAPLRRYTAMVQTYDHRDARRLRHCGVMPLWCRHRAVVLHVHQYDGKARHALIKAHN